MGQTEPHDLDSATIARLAAEHLGIVFSIEPTDVIGADGVDAVYIATPPGTHAALVVPALQAGQAVFCEKPLSVSRSRQSYRLSNWRDLFVAEGNGWQSVDLTGEQGSEGTRLSLFARAIRGEPSPDLADFAAAYRVQQVVEAFHHGA